MIVDLPRRWRWVVGIACGGIVGLAALFVWVSRSAERRTDVPAAGVPAVAGAASAAAPGLPAAPDPVAVRDAEQVEVCGAGWVAAGPDGQADPAAVERVVGPARERLLAEMQADSSEQVQASATWLRAAPDRDATLDRLARAAVASSDPAVYAMAFRACERRTDGPCRLLTAERWAQLDPDNAQPWIYLFSAAGARNDAGTQQEALYRIAGARRDWTGAFAAAGAVVDAAPDDGPSQLAAEQLAIRAIGLDAALATAPPMRGVAAACGGDALKDANRVQTCSAIAELLSDRSDQLTDREVGVRIGRQVGWPADRVDEARGELSAYEASWAAGPMADTGLGCTAVADRLGAMRQLGAGGHAGALREWVAQSGRTADDFIRAERERRAAQVAARVASRSSE